MPSCGGAKVGFWLVWVAGKAASEMESSSMTIVSANCAGCGVKLLDGIKPQEASKIESSAIHAKTFVYFWATNNAILSFERFISSRLIRQKHLGLRVSRPVLRISVASIALAILVNTLTLAIVRGFQQKIKDKITGFNAPLFISKAGSAHIFEAEALDRRIPFLAELAQIKGLKSVQAVGFKPIMLQSQRFSDTIQLQSGKDSVVARQDLLGLLFKGVDSDYDWSFIKTNLYQGRLPRKKNINEVLISLNVAKKLNINLNDEVSVFHIKQQPLLKKVRVVGLYNTGFTEYDQQLVFGNLALVQQMSDNGTQIALRPQLDLNATLIKVEVQGDASNLLFDWGLGPDVYTAHRFTNLVDTTLKVIAYRFQNNTDQFERIDSATVLIDAPHLFKHSDLQFESGEPICLTDGLTKQIYASKNGELRFEFKDGAGTGAHFVSGFEISIDNFDELKRIEAAVRNTVEMRPVNQHLLQVSNIKDTEADLFSWLDFLDFNVLIIIVLMLVIGIINIGSAMLVLIVVRTSFVGLLKALGANNRSIRRIFLYQAAYLLFRGLLIGNVVAIVLCFLQQNYSIVQLNPEVYYLDAVPVEFSFWNFLLVNILTFVTCMIALLLPSRVVGRISPVKALKFQ